jgi:hypothetical protein
VAPEPVEETSELSFLEASWVWVLEELARAEEEWVGVMEE